MEIFGILGLPIIVTVLIVGTLLFFAKGNPPFPYVLSLSLLVMVFIINFCVSYLDDPHGQSQQTDLIVVGVIDAFGAILLFLFVGAQILEERDKNKRDKR